MSYYSETKRFKPISSPYRHTYSKNPLVKSNTYLKRIKELEKELRGLKNDYNQEMVQMHNTIDKLCECFIEYKDDTNKKIEQMEEMITSQDSDKIQIMSPKPYSAINSYIPDTPVSEECIKDLSAELSNRSTKKQPFNFQPNKSLYKTPPNCAEKKSITDLNKLSFFSQEDSMLEHKLIPRKDQLEIAEENVHFHESRSNNLDIITDRNSLRKDKYTTNRVRESSFNMEQLKPKIEIDHLQKMSRYGFSVFNRESSNIPHKSQKLEESNEIEDFNAVFDTISAASIQDDEEGTNLNAKGINTNYVKHYNSINKTREEEKKEEKQRIKKERSGLSTNFNQCFCNHDEELSSSINSSRLLESSTYSERKYATSTNKDSPMINFEEDETDQGLVINPIFRPPSYKICSQYCKKMPSWSQKMIIESCLKEYLKSFVEVGKIQLVSNPENPSELMISERNKTPIPPPAKMRIKNEKKYLISSSWWRKWCDYTNFDEVEIYSFTGQPSSVRMNIESQNPLKSSFKLPSSSSNSPIKQEENNYAQPGKITNEPLIRSPEELVARTDIVEYHDYVSLDMKTWSYIKNWYGYDYCLINFSMYDSMGDKIIVKVN
ncbi:unnamed protein product [Moneuplotes crassus]|uniref:DUSP domain-containing protein n=1 Tax=Euplotes crassus TaxID=5936 RepID=A0AAD1U0V9_EUPCR|nr:unnamed protein product [Moneuplotes crassus]